METYYLVDFENVHNEEVKYISSLSKEDHIHIFYTKRTLNIHLDIALAKDVDIVGHKVSEGDESLDKHLLSYLGYILGMNKGESCAYVIIAKDKGYDKVINFWRQEGFTNISRMTCIPEKKAHKQPEKAGNEVKREAQIRSLYGQHFKKKVYVENKEATINILLKAKTRQAVNNELLKLYGDGKLVSVILKVYQPLMKELPGK